MAQIHPIQWYTYLGGRLIYPHRVPKGLSGSSVVFPGPFHSIGTSHLHLHLPPPAMFPILSLSFFANGTEAKLVIGVGGRRLSFAPPSGMFSRQLCVD